MKGIEGRSVIVTGGASGIGEAAVRLLVENGANVTIADLNDAAGEALAEELNRGSRKAQFVRTNIASEPDVRAMVEVAMATFGKVDGAFNNAAVPNLGKPLADITLDEFTRCQEINVMGTFLCLKYEIKAMLNNGSGSIVNTSSTCGLVNVPMTSEYTASKHAVSGLTKAAASDYGSNNIRVNAIAPSATRTPMYEGYRVTNPNFDAQVAALHLLRRASDPIEQAEAAVWLLSDAASFVTGVILPTDGGYTAV